MLIGVTSQNFRTVTGHAGKARRFLVYQVEPGQPPVEAERLDLPKDQAIHEHPEGAPHPLGALDVLVTGGCGEGFVRKLAAMGVRVVVTETTDPATAAAQAAA